MGQRHQSFDMKVDQQKKTLQSKTGEGEKVKYKVSGDVHFWFIWWEELRSEAAWNVQKRHPNAQITQEKRGISALSSLKHLESVFKRRKSDC